MKRVSDDMTELLSNFVQPLMGLAFTAGALWAYDQARPEEPEELGPLDIEAMVLVAHKKVEGEQPQEGVALSILPYANRNHQIYS